MNESELWSCDNRWSYIYSIGTGLGDHPHPCLCWQIVSGVVMWTFPLFLFRVDDFHRSQATLGSVCSQTRWWWCFQCSSSLLSRVTDVMFPTAVTCNVLDRTGFPPVTARSECFLISDTPSCSNWASQASLSDSQQIWTFTRKSFWI